MFYFWLDDLVNDEAVFQVFGDRKRISFEDLITSVDLCSKSANNSTKKEEETMSELFYERDYLKERLSKIKTNLGMKAERLCGIRDDEHPNTATKMLKRLKDQQYVICSDRNGLFPYIRWKDPNVKEDWERLDALTDKYKVEAQKVEDCINILSPAEALAQVQKFEEYVLE